MRVVFLEGPLYGYRLPFLTALQAQVERLQVCVAGLGFDLPEHELQASGLDVTRLHSIVVNRSLRHPIGFSEAIPLDLPWDVIRVLSRFQPDVILSTEMGLRTLQAAVFRRNHPKRRLVIWARLTEHSEAGRGPARTLLRKSLVRHADAIITNGSSGRRYLVGLGAAPTQVHVVHQASSLHSWPSEQRPGRPLRMLFVGRLVTGKGLHLLLPTLAGYPLGSWELTVAGDGPERNRLQAFTSQHRLPVEFTGFVPRGGLPRLFADHDVFVFPTLKDEWGLVVGEALRAGLPVLGSIYSEAVCEIVVDGETGWTMRPDRPESVRIALDRAFTATAAEWLRARQLAAASVRQLTPETMADQFLSILRVVRSTNLVDRLAVG